MARFRIRPRRRAFTLVELLVVIAIIGVLVALLLPAVQKAREAGRRMSCGNNLKQIGLGLHNYHDTYKTFPPGGITPGNCCGTPSAGTWAVFILPFMGRENLHARYAFDWFNEDNQNAFARTQFISDYVCPSDLNTDRTDRPESGPGRNRQYAPGSYRGVSGASTGSCWFDANQTNSFCINNRGVLHHIGGRHRHRSGGRMMGPERFATILDGSANTLLVGEYHTKSRNRRRTFWAYTYTSYNQSSVVVGAPRQLIPDYNHCVGIGGHGGSNTCKRGWGSFHPGVIQFCFADGRVRGIATTVDMGIRRNSTSAVRMGVLPSLASIQGGEFVEMPQ